MKLYKSLLYYLCAACILLQPAKLTAQTGPVDVQDSLALIDLYNNNGGPGWAWQWDLSKSVREWHGIVFTNAAGLENRVVGLDLNTNNMTGVLPASIGNLTALTYLSFWRNNLSGLIPASIGNLTLLTSLDLSSNQFSGTIPASFGNLINLQFLHVGSNQLRGKIPAEIGNLTHLQFLTTFNNNLTFDGFETIYTELVSTQLNTSPQANLTIHNNKGTLAVTANGTLANNSYLWHNGDNYKDTTIIGDSTFTPLTEGIYTVTIQNSIIGFNYRLVSDPLPVKKINILAINPNPSFLNPDGSIQTSVSFPLANTVKGVAADGITKLVCAASSTVPITFNISDVKDGSLGNLLQQGITGNAVTVNPVNNEVSFIYTAPDGYGANEKFGGRNIQITARSTEGNEGVITLQLRTPPVVLVHGMWSGPEVWKENGFLTTLVGNGIRGIRTADYSDYASLTYAINDGESIYGRKSIANAVAGAIADYAADSIVATQADIAGHSLGGLMSRSFSQQQDFVNLSNYNKGYIHKLITIGTPHRGSPLGPVLWNGRNNYTYLHINSNVYTIPVKLSILTALAKMPIGSVHRDFGIESDGIKSLTATLPFKTYAITAVFLPDKILDYEALSTVTHVLFDKSLNTIFASRCDPNIPLSSDVIVPLSSQQGYISSDTLFFGTSHSMVIPETIVPLGHTEVDNPAIQNKVSELLLSNDPTEFSNGFPAPSLQPLDCFTVTERKANTNNSTTKEASSTSKVYTDPGNKFVQITLPLSGSNYINSNSDSITLAYQPQNGMMPDSSVFLVGGIGIIPALPVPPYTAGFRLYANARPGKINIVLFSKDADGNTFADTSHINILPGGNLDSITASPSPVLTMDSAFRQVHVKVFGFYTNGAQQTQEDISSASTGTIYSSQKGESVFKVSADGLVTAVAAGSDSLIINNNGKRTSISIVVAANFNQAVLYANSIDFSAIPDQVLSNAPIVPDANAASGEAVDFTIVSGPAVVTNGIIFLTGIGAVTVQANAPGNSYFSNASPVARSFNITASLPVSLSDFNAKRSSSAQVNLLWQTVSEQNNKGFGVERKLENETSFSLMGFVNSEAQNGNSSIALNYTFTDANTYKGTSYYRLRQTGTDGKNIYSPVKVVNGWGGANVSVQVWPNPAKDFFTIKMDGITGSREAVLTDMFGRNIRKLNITSGQQITVQNLTTGVYIFTIVNAFGQKENFKQKVVVTN